jgi:hypothetical protein
VFPDDDESHRAGTTKRLSVDPTAKIVTFQPVPFLNHREHVTKPELNFGVSVLHH